MQLLLWAVDARSDFIQFSILIRFLVLKWQNDLQRSEFLKIKEEDKNEHNCHQVPNHEQVHLLAKLRQLSRLQLQQQQLLVRARCVWHLPACSVLFDLVAGSHKKINLFFLQLAIGKFELKKKCSKTENFELKKTFENQITINFELTNSSTKVQMFVVHDLNMT